ncbi:MAG: carboxymuconolactone decarboxylase family protein [Deltaproteobacteria bacterium]
MLAAGAGPGACRAVSSPEETSLTSQAEVKMKKSGHADPRYQKGLEVGQRLGGDAFSAVVGKLEEVDDELANYLVGGAYGAIMARPQLSLEDSELVIISCLAVQGYLPQLEWHIAAALRIGVPPEAVREVLVQVIPYAGWPAALNALGAMKKVFAERQISLEHLPKTPASRPERSALNLTGRERGGAVYADYADVERTLAEYDPELPGYLTENSYGQIYARPGLDMRRRELIAVAMLTAQQRLPQLGWHIEGAHRVGGTPIETKEVIITMLLYVGWPAALNALEVWKQKSK